MLPSFNSAPYPSNQLQTHGTPGAASQQVMQSNHFHGNPAGFSQNPGQVQAQTGIINAQIAMPFNNFNTHMGNGSVAMPNGLPASTTTNVNNPLLSLQNAMSLLGSSNLMPNPVQFQGQGPFGPQGSNPVSLIPMAMNPNQPPNQLYAHTSANLSPFYSQGVCFQNGQLCLQMPMQNTSHLVPIPLSNYSQAVPCNLPSYQSQLCQALGIQAPAILANPQFGIVQPNATVQQSNQGQHMLVPPAVSANATKQAQNTPQQLQENSSLPFATGSATPRQTQKLFGRHNFTKLQGNNRKDGRNTRSNDNWKNSQNKNLAKNVKRDAFQRRFPNSNFHNAQNGKGKFSGHSQHGEKEYKNDGTRTAGDANSTNQAHVGRKRSLLLNYTEQEIQQWREARKKNYPSKANIEKKQVESMTEPETTDSDAKLRRQQLKEILAKQEELGFEVPEIPSHYLSDSDKPVHGKEENRKALTKEQFQNKFNKGGRFHQNDRSAKKQKLEGHGSSKALNCKTKFRERSSGTKLSTKPKRPPTLLQKLLSADIKREKKHLLQVFRFMVMNAFFKDSPEKPLRFPLVVVNEARSESEVVEQKSPSVGKSVSETGYKLSIEESEYVNGENGGKNAHEVGAQVSEPTYSATLKGSRGGEADDTEEEGEIID